MKTPEVFISYSHRDERFKDELLRHLRPLEKNGNASFWDTSLIPAGQDWSKEIKKAIEQADVAILLISPDFLSSDYVVNQELPMLLSRAMTRDTLVLPILIRPALWTTVPELAQFQFLNDVRKPLSSSESRDEDYVRISQTIADVITAHRNRLTQEATAPDRDKEEPPPHQNGHVFLSHSKYDSDFAELAKLKLEKVGFSAWIDDDRLEPGVDWRQEIDDSIKKAHALVAIMSPEARESEYVTYEWAYAWGRDVPLIPIMLKETPLHPRLAALQYLDFTNHRARPWEKLFESLRKAKKKGY